MSLYETASIIRWYLRRGGTLIARVNGYSYHVFNCRVISGRLVVRSRYWPNSSYFDSSAVVFSLLDANQIRWIMP